VAVEPAEPYRHEVSRTGPQRGSYLDGLGQTGPARTSRTMLDATPVSRSRTAARRGRARRHGRARIAIIAVVAALGAVALVATAVNALTAGSHPAAATPVPRPSPSTSTSGATPQPQSTWRYIDARADDPIPLTLAELFPAHVSAGQVTYGRTAERATTTCRGAVFGARLKAAVAKGCSQALRASYLSGDAKQMGTIGVLNLATSAAAAKVGKIVASAGEFIEPLPAAHGATKNLGKGTGVVWAVAKGHYLILMWAQYANLHSPTSSHDRKVLMQLLNDLYRTTANQSLTGRMVTGKPSTP
jgi:hypothetical protein